MSPGSFYSQSQLEHFEWKKKVAAFFVNGRAVTLLDGKRGVFIEKTKSGMARVFAGTMKEPTSGVFLVEYETLVKANEANIK